MFHKPSHAKPRRPGRHRKSKSPHMRLLLAGPLLGLVLLAGCATAADTQDAAQADEQTPNATPTLDGDPPDPTPEPDGDFTGSCDYTLPSDIDGDYELIGDVEVANTGNVGIQVKVTIKWLQMGHDPVTASEKIMVPYGQTETVRFAETVSSTVIDRVQSYQLNADFDDSYCKYEGEILQTYGVVQ